jgi:eukaryotic-like serine/threonine-protein kinase
MEHGPGACAGPGRSVGPAGAGPIPLNEPTEDLPAKVGRYRLDGEIIHGGMARIVRVCDEDFDRPLAMKLALARGTGIEARFVREAQMTGLLQHPGIPPVHAWGRLAREKDCLGQPASQCVSP